MDITVCHFKKEEEEEKKPEGKPEEKPLREPKWKREEKKHSRGMPAKLARALPSALRVSFLNMYKKMRKIRFDEDLSLWVNSKKIKDTNLRDLMISLYTGRKSNGIETFKKALKSDGITLPKVIKL